MKQNKIFFTKISKSVFLGLVLLGMAFDNSVVAATAGRTAIRASRTSAIPVNTVVATNTEPTEIIEESVAIVETPVAPVIENKSSQFNTVLGEVQGGSTDIAAQSLAEQIRAQRAALDADSVVASTNATLSNTGGTNSTCDSQLRICMHGKCGKTFEKCFGDGDSEWGLKLDECKRNSSTCNGHEFSVFAVEIKADRNNNAMLATYTETIDCGNKFNTCLVGQCSTREIPFEKCLSKLAADNAIATCLKTMPECKKIDTALESRSQEAFGILRIGTENQIKRDEERLYALRDEMKSVCNKMGAMFDERSLDCVYTIDFWAQGSNKPFASKKAYAGNTFDCTQDWFGIDITTFKENAYRLTRSQSAASSGLMGAGIGIGASSLVSGISGSIGGGKSDAVSTVANSVAGDKTTTQPTTNQAQ